MAQSKYCNESLCVSVEYYYHFIIQISNSNETIEDNTKYENETKPTLIY